ncbi:MAG: two-CW domain-containing protein [Thermodesulfobacteriota bacterium]
MCWDYLQCKNKERCPAFPDNGRSCWDVSGTLCRGQVQGNPESKRDDCISLCGFLEKVVGGKI